VKAEIDAAVQEALAMPMPDPDSAVEGVFAERESLLEDGNAPWSGFQGA
jgi:pyruvate dehydrogenase E1 component alpha subunit